MEMYIATFLFLAVMIYLGMLKLVLGEDRRKINMADKAALVPQRPTAPATFLGYQKLNDQGLEQPLELWTLTADIPGHPVSSTVSRRTLEKAGYVVPLPLEEPPAPAPPPQYSPEVPIPSLASS